MASLPFKMGRWFLWVHVFVCYISISIALGAYFKKYILASLEFLFFCLDVCAGLCVAFVTAHIVTYVCGCACVRRVASVPPCLISH